MTSFSINCCYIHPGNILTSNIVQTEQVVLTYLEILVAALCDPSERGDSGSPKHLLLASLGRY